MLNGVKKCKDANKIYVNSLLLDSAAKKVTQTTSEIYL
jgi:hypothetical protein